MTASTSLFTSSAGIWPVIVVHAAFDLAGFVPAPRSARVADSISIVLAALVALALIVISRHNFSDAVTASRANR